MITDIPGASDFFSGGIIAYADSVKIELLGIPPEVLQRDGAVSARTALLMARNGRELFKSDLSLAVTGIAGPGGGSPHKPVGLVYLAAASPDREKTEKHIFSGSRLLIKEAAADTAFSLLEQVL